MIHASDVVKFLVFRYAATDTNFGHLLYSLQRACYMPPSGLEFTQKGLSRLLIDGLTDFATKVFDLLRLPKTGTISG